MRPAPLPPRPGHRGPKGPTRDRDPNCAPSTTSWLGITTRAPPHVRCRPGSGAFLATMGTLGHGMWKLLGKPHPMRHVRRKAHVSTAATPEGTSAVTRVLSTQRRLPNHPTPQPASPPSVFIHDPRATEAHYRTNPLKSQRESSWDGGRARTSTTCQKVNYYHVLHARPPTSDSAAQPKPRCPDAAPTHRWDERKAVLAV